MARKQKSGYEQLASKSPGQTVQNRDVYEKQQLERSEIEGPQSATSRIVVAVIGSILVGLLVYCVLSFAVGTFNLIGGVTNSAVGGISGSGTGGNIGGFGALDVYDDSDDWFGATDESDVGSQGSVDGTSGTAGSDGVIYVQDGQGGAVKITPGNQPIVSEAEWLFEKNYTRAGDMYYDWDMNELSTAEVQAEYIAYLESLGATVTQVETYVGEDGQLYVKTSEDGSEGSVTGSNSGEGTDTTQGQPGQSEGSQSGLQGSEGQASDQQDGNFLMNPTENSNAWLAMLAPSMWKVLVSLLATGISFALFYQVLMRNLAKENTMYDTSDINQNQNDQHIAFPEEIQSKFDWFPDVGAHSAVQVSSLISHMMIATKGLNNIQVAERATENILDDEGQIDIYKGEILYDDDGEPITKSMPMIDEQLGKALFKSAKIPKEYQIFYDTRKIKYNPGNENRNKLKGYDTVADLINKEWEFPEYEPQRPAGAYIVDTEPVKFMCH